MIAPVRVTQFQRHPSGAFSVERLFEDVRAHLPKRIECRVVTSAFESRGLVRRVLNLIHAAFRSSGIDHITGDVYYLALALKRGSVLTILDCASLHRTAGWRRRLLQRVWYDVPIARAAVVTTISESAKEELLRLGCPEDKIVVIPCCVSPEFVPAPRPFNRASPVVLQVGTTENKNIERLAAALRGMSCRLHVLGTLSARQVSALRDNEIDYAASNGLSRERTAALYREADVVALVSTYEGFGLPIVEAQATGRVVVTSDAFSMPEVAGGGACLVDPLSVESIRAGLMKVVTDDDYRAGLITAGFENVRRFRCDAIADAYAALYERVACHGLLVCTE